MGYEAFVYVFKEGKAAGISRQQVRDAFGSFLTDGGVFDWHLHYGEADNCDVMLDVDDNDKTVLRGFTVHRPCGDLRFWDAMAAILRLGNIVLFFPDNRPPLVAHRGVVRHLPADMVESLGEPKPVVTGKEILDILHAA